MLQVCAISNTGNGVPLRVPLDEVSNNTIGFVLCGQSRAVDSEAGNAEFKDRASENVLTKVRGIRKAAGLMD